MGLSEAMVASTWAADTARLARRPAIQVGFWGALLEALFEACGLCQRLRTAFAPLCGLGPSVVVSPWSPCTIEDRRREKPSLSLSSLPSCSVLP